MASFPSFVDRDTLNRREARTFEEMVKAVPPPAAGRQARLAVEDFDDGLKGLIPPGQAFAQRREAEDFDEMAATLEPPGQAYARKVAPPPQTPAGTARPAPAAFPDGLPPSGAPVDALSSVAAPPPGGEGVGGPAPADARPFGGGLGPAASIATEQPSPVPQPPGTASAQAPADDPVQRTLDFLTAQAAPAGIGPDALTRSVSPGATAPPPGTPGDGGAVGGSWDRDGGAVGGSWGDDPMRPGLPPRREPLPDYPIPDAIGKGIEAIGTVYEGGRDLDERTFGPTAERQLDEMAAQQAAISGVPQEEARRQVKQTYDLAMTVGTVGDLGAAGEAGRGLVDRLGNAVRRPAERVPILGPEGETLKSVRVPKIAPEMASKPIMPEAIVPTQHVSAVRKIVDRSRNIIGSMGEGGQDLARRVHMWRDDAEVEAADWIRRMPTVQKLSKNETTNLVDVLERGRVGAAADAVPMNSRVQQAAAEAKDVLDEVYVRAQNAGVDVGPKIENYFPHTFSRESIEALKRDDVQRAAQKHLLDSGQASSPEEAQAIVGRFVDAGRDRRSGSLEMERLANMPGYEKTKEALYGHLMDASRRIHEIAQFGRDDAIAERLFQKMAAEGYDVGTATNPGTARDLFNTIVRAKRYGDLEQQSAGLIRQYLATTRLGLSAIGNTTQPMTNVAPIVGVGKTARMQAKLGATHVVDTILAAIGQKPTGWADAEKDFALKSAATLDSVIDEVREGAGWSDKVAAYVRPGFNVVEKDNRIVAANLGRDFAIEQARRAAGGSRQALRALEKMGLDAAAVAKRGVLTEAEEITAARSIVERTQFRVDPQDLPGWASSPWGKVLAQFRTFGYNQSAYVGRELLQEAAKGNPGPLIRFLIVAPLVSGAAIEARNVVAGRESEQDPVKRAAQYAMGPLGVVGDIGRAVLPINSDRLTADRQGAMIAGAVAGPAFGGLAELAGGAANALHGNWVPAGRTALRQIPVVGSTVQNFVLPYEKTGASKFTLPGGRPDTSRSSSRPDTSRKDTRR
jgi:hypothetical protein